LKNRIGKTEEAKRDSDRGKVGGLKRCQITCIGSVLYCICPGNGDGDERVEVDKVGGSEIYSVLREVGVEESSLKEKNE
jgi:hypothetical protein